MNNPGESIIEQVQYIHFFEDREKGLIQQRESFRAIPDYFKNLLKFAHYRPPTAAGFDAPISLAFASMENGERILVRKTYVPGSQPLSANIHLLVGFPPGFLLRDAIMFWNPSFWNDAKIQDTSLSSLPLHTLKKYIDEPFPLYDDLQAAKEYLPSLLQFFLLQRVSQEQPGAGEKCSVPRILINLPADYVAYLIYALSRLLPSQLLNTTTFNTYEHDLRNQFYTICGTWSVDLASYAEDDFILTARGKSEPQQLCVSGISSVLRERIVGYVDQAMRWFDPYQPLAADVSTFLAALEASPQLFVESFLTQCERFGGSSAIPSANKQLPQSNLIPEKPADATSMWSREEMQRRAEQILAEKKKKAAIVGAPNEPLSPQYVMEEFAKGPENVRKFLDEESRRRYMIGLVLTNPERFEKQVLEHLKAWLEFAADTPKDRKVLSKLLQSVTTISIQAIRQRKADAFHNSIWLLDYFPVLLPGDKSDWRNLLWTLYYEPNYKVLLQNDWFCREFLLDIAEQVLSAGLPEDEKMITPLLDVTPAEIGDLLIVPVSSPQTLTHVEAHELRFHVGRWSYVAIKLCVQGFKAVLPPDVIHYFNQHHELVSVLFTEIGSLSTTNRWLILAYFLNGLAKSGYQYKDDLITYLFSKRLPVDAAEEIVACLSEADQEALFRCYENLCIEYFPSSENFRHLTLRCLPASLLTWQQISNLDLMFSKLRTLSKKEIDALVPDLAKLLDACVDGPMSLGMLLPSLLRLEKSQINALFRDMAAFARHVLEAQLDGAHKRRLDEDARQSIVHFSSYIQFALSFQHLYDAKRIPPDLREVLLDTLLNEAPEHVFVLINSEAKYWPADLCMDWERMATHYRTPPPPPPPPPDLRQLSREEEEMIAQIDRLIEKGGARELGLFWLEHSIMLHTLGKELVNGDATTMQAANRWKYLRTSYAFYVACKKADYGKKGSQALQEAEQEMVEIVQRSRDFLRLTPKEHKRVEKVQKRLTIRTIP